MVTLAGGPTLGQVGVGSSSAPRANVDLGMISALQEHGMRSPLRGLHDPRTGFPELLITSGWDREEIDCGYAYRFVAQEDGLSTWQQYYECHEDGSCLLLTRAGSREQVITRDPGGRVASALRPSLN